MKKTLSFTYPYPRASVTVDAVVFRPVGSAFEILLIQRANPPFEGSWALPGGFLDMHETLEEAVNRELKEETNLIGIHLKQLHTFSAVHRDPRGRTLTVVFWGIMMDNQTARAGDDAKHLEWFDLHHLPELAFDHKEVVEMAIRMLHPKQTQNIHG